MEKKIEQLYEAISLLGFQSTYARKNNYVQKCVQLFPEIEQFVQWFFDNVSGVEEGIYLNLADILKDCETALTQNDNVLMMDALEQGITGYLEMFLPEEYFEKKEIVYVK